jgi:hypothetical protein
MVSMGAALTANAAPVIYDFAGSGQVCTYTGVSYDAICADQTFSGSVTLNVLADAPSGPGSGGDGVTNAYASSGWVEPDILIQWGSSSFNAAPTPGPTQSDWYTQVWNDFIGIDALQTREYYLGETNGLLYWSWTRFDRYTLTDTSWLSDVSFDLDAGLAPGVATNKISFDQHSGGLDFGAPLNWSGFYGHLDLTALTLRSTAVPEPATWTLFGLSLAAVIRTRRRLQK